MLNYDFRCINFKPVGRYGYRYQVQRRLARGQYRPRGDGSKGTRPNIQKQYRYMEKQRQWMHASKWYCTPQCHQFDRRAAACLGRVYWARTELGWKYYIHVDKDKTAFNIKHTKKTAYDIEKVLGAKVEDGTPKPHSFEKIPIIFKCFFRIL